MSLIFVVLAFIGVGAYWRRSWTLALPIAAGSLAAVLMAASGHGLGDTPIPFLVILSTVATAVGIVLRRFVSGRYA